MKFAMAWTGKHKVTSYSLIWGLASSALRQLPLSLDCQQCQVTHVSIKYASFLWRFVLANSLKLLRTFIRRFGGRNCKPWARASQYLQTPPLSRTRESN